MQACGRQAKCTPIPVPCTLLCYDFVQLFLSFIALALSLCPNTSCRLFLLILACCFSTFWHCLAAVLGGGGAFCGAACNYIVQWSAARIRLVLARAKQLRLVVAKP